MALNLWLPSFRQSALDGEYTIEYLLEDSSNIEYSKTIKVFSSCLVRCCIDKMWASYAEGIASDCSCTLSSNALEAEALYRAMMSSTGCLDSNSRNIILTKLQRICELEECNC